MVVGVIGGGQLGRMLGLAGIPLGLSFRFLDPAPDAPAGAVGELLVGAYDDVDLLARLADGADVVTYEFENVPVEAARRVGAVPGPAALEAAQDRLAEKRLFRRLGIPTARIDDEVEAFPALLKTRRLGYDGKGQRLVDEHPGSDPDHVLEELVAFDRELSLIAVRAARRRDALLPARRERPRGRHPPQLERAGGRRPAGAGRGLRRPHPGGARLRRRARARALRGGRRAARERAGAARPQHRALDDRGRRRRASSRTTSARSLGLPLGPTDLRGEAAMVNLIGTRAAARGRPRDPRRAPAPVRQGAAAGPQARPRHAARSDSRARLRARGGRRGAARPSGVATQASSGLVRVRRCACGCAWKYSSRRRRSLTCV